MPGPYCNFEERRVHQLEKLDDDHARCKDCGEVLDRDQLRALIRAGALSGGCGSLEGPASLDRPSRDGFPGGKPKRPPPIV